MTKVTHTTVFGLFILSNWGRVMHICVGKLTIIGSDNDLASERRQAIVCTSDGIMLIGTSGTNVSEIFIEIHIFPFISWFLHRDNLSPLRLYRTSSPLGKLFFTQKQLISHTKKYFVWQGTDPQTGLICSEWYSQSDHRKIVEPPWSVLDS